MQPRRKGRLPAERADLAVELEERLLGQILRFGRIRCHAQAERIHAALVLVVEGLERLSVSKFSLLDQLSFR